MDQYTGFQDKNGKPIVEKQVLYNVRTKERVQVIYDKAFGYMLMNTKTGHLDRLDENSSKLLSDPIGVDIDAQPYDHS